MMSVPPSVLVERLFYLNGAPFSIRDYPYLRAIYDSKAREIGLFTARQVSKSTTLATMLIMHSVLVPKSSQILVSPLQEQAIEFSTSRLKDLLTNSPIIKTFFFSGKNVVDQVLRKQFENGSMISLGYAQRTADRLRGRSVLGDHSILGFDEVQDIYPDVIPVLKEMTFRTKNPRFLYCGTPKSMNNHMEAMRARSTACEWAVKCDACSKWNLEWTERNIGNDGVICQYCGARLDTSRGMWVASRRLDVEKGKDASVTMESYRIPQLIVKPIMDDRSKWVELLNKLKTYSTERFRNEVLGLPYDGGAQPVTLDQLAACCDETRPNVPPRVGSGPYPPLVIGVDWAFHAEKSYTFIVIGGWNPFPQCFDVLYWKIYAGAESDTMYQIDDIVRLFHLCGCRLIAADWGAGHVQNLKLIELLGEDAVAQMWHTGMRARGESRPRARWDPKTRRWHLARTAVLTDTFETIRRRQVVFPRRSECRELFDHILAESLEFNEATNTPQYTNAAPDDGLHSLTYAMLGSELYVTGGFRGHAGSDPAAWRDPAAAPGVMDDPEYM